MTTILAVVSSAHERLYHDYFLKTLPRGLRLREFHMGTNSSDGSFLSGEWQEAMCVKVRHALTFCRSAREGEVFIVSDVDVQFFSDFDVQFFERHFESSTADLVFQKERFRPGDSEVCCGFYAARNTPAVVALLEEALHRLTLAGTKNEQVAINALLRERAIPHEMLDRRFYARTHGFPPPRGIWMHHANWTSSVDEKAHQLDRVRRILVGGSLRLHVESFAEMLSRPVPGVSRARFSAESALRFLGRMPLTAGSLP